MVNIFVAVARRSPRYFPVPSWRIGEMRRNARIHNEDYRSVWFVSSALDTSPIPTAYIHARGYPLLLLALSLRCAIILGINYSQTPSSVSVAMAKPMSAEVTVVAAGIPGRNPWKCSNGERARSPFESRDFHARIIQIRFCLFAKLQRRESRRDALIELSSFVG